MRSLEWGAILDNTTLPQFKRFQFDLMLYNSLMKSISKCHLKGNDKWKQTNADIFIFRCWAHKIIIYIASHSAFVSLFGAFFENLSRNNIEIKKLERQIINGIINIPLTKWLYQNQCKSCIGRHLNIDLHNFRWLYTSQHVHTVLYLEQLLTWDFRVEGFAF